MSDTEQKYFVSVEVKWGKDNAGVQTAESVGGQTWGALSYDQSVVIQGAVLKPGLDAMFGAAIDLGLDAIELSGTVLPEDTKNKVKGKKPV